MSAPKEEGLDLGTLFLETCVMTVLIVLARIMYLIHKITTGHTRINDKKRVKPAKTIICMGSGGHTTEMLNLIKNMDFRNKYLPRYYIIASNDHISLDKVLKFETIKSNGRQFKIKKIPRNRNVHQSYFSSIFTTIYAIVYCIPLVVKEKPDLIICNGPGSCIPICMVAFLLRVGFIHDSKLIFVESFCRVQTFSLTGKILMYFADNVIVQWPSLQKKLKRSEYIGQLM